jgi:hypothetical protein
MTHCAYYEVGETFHVVEYNSQFPKVENEADTIALIEATFAKAKEPTVHPTNKSLHVQRVFPLLPDEDLLPNEYHFVTFDQNPKPLSSENGHSGRAGKVQSAIIRTLDEGSDDNDYITAFYVPPDRIEKGEINTYDFVREYDATVCIQDKLEDGTKPQEFENFVLHWNRDSSDPRAVARFAPLHPSSIACRKRSVVTTDVSVAKGYNLNLSRREWSDDELWKREAAMMDIDIASNVVDDVSVDSSDGGVQCTAHETDGGVCEEANNIWDLQNDIQLDINNELDDSSDEDSVSSHRGEGAASSDDDEVFCEDISSTTGGLCCLS